jgi:hypothetical protein
MDIEQAPYQVRLGWGRCGVTRVAADADVIVWVDLLGDVVPTTWPPGADVVASDLHTAAAAAAWVVERQHQLARRLTVAVVAAGDPERDGAYAVEDHLAAGAFVGALGELGIDATSPDAAVAEAAHRALRSAVGHLVSASTAGRAAGADPADYRITATTPRTDVRIIQTRGRPG